MTQKQNSKNVDTNIKVLLNSHYDDDGGDNNDGSDVTRDRLSNYPSSKADAAGLLDPPQNIATSYLH